MLGDHEGRGEGRGLARELLVVHQRELPEDGREARLLVRNAAEDLGRASRKEEHLVRGDPTGDGEALDVGGLVVLDRALELDMEPAQDALPLLQEAVSGLGVNAREFCEGADVGFSRRGLKPPVVPSTPTYWALSSVF